MKNKIDKINLPVTFRAVWLNNLMSSLGKKLFESFVSVLPVVVIILIINFTPFIDLTKSEMGVFLISSLFLIIGIGLFNLGADMAMTPMGEHVGSGLTKSGKIKTLLLVGFVMGVLITIAEPDLTVLANQVGSVLNKTTLIVAVGVGVGIFLLLGIIRIMTKRTLAPMLMFFYLILFSIAAIMSDTGKGVFLTLSFDSGGVTTGPITVPFIMALGVGVALTLGGKKANENSFGLVALCSIGPMVAVMLLTLTAKGEPTYSLPDYSLSANLGNNFLPMLLSVFLEVGKALGLIVLFFVILQVTVLKLPKKKIVQIAVGIVYTLVGLTMFLAAVRVGFMPVGFKIGQELAKNKTVLIIFAFVIGAVVVLAEPAIHVLNNQVEEVTLGMVTKRSMLIALSIGVGLSICLSVIRVIYGFSVLYYLVPGYCISLGLSFFVPKIYTAIAFDAGGVASGPLSSSFILPLAIGACASINGVDSVLSNAFGVVAMIAMTPLITIQFLGFKSMVTSKIREIDTMKQIISADDEQIIDFM